MHRLDDAATDEDGIDAAIAIMKLVNARPKAPHTRAGPNPGPAPTPQPRAAANPIPARFFTANAPRRIAPPTPHPWRRSPPTRMSHFQQRSHSGHLSRPRGCAAGRGPGEGFFSYSLSLVAPPRNSPTARRNFLRWGSCRGAKPLCTASK